jgi:hypothetical protein
MPILRRCEHCNVDFFTPEWRIKQGKGKYCSKECFYGSRNYTKLYQAEMQAYCDAKRRCQNPKHKQWPGYGGRGIEFKFDSFSAFIDHIGPRPEGLTLDRINNDSHYEIGNVRWADRKTQANNRRPPTCR